MKAPYSDKGGDGNMEERIGRLETFAEEATKRLAVIEQDLAVIKATYVTKADLAEAKSSIIVWVVSAIFLAQLLPRLLDKLGF
jgi:hypothetical protein